ncbi:GYDIA family GHMP kinase [Lewinella sp. W8]|uniref:GYDIA family GHMP kinase n=1 Tax=Lewinella sp. W8 TaxID=2528208 RepID=UPI0010686611|nr:GYDIA family GHMP kinase [Lewinella sp. W8]MTB52718.1 GHMP kinase [Lewinella sp. W8]
MSQPDFHHYAHGKLLLTGEYFILDGVPGLAVPTSRGQHFRLWKGAATEGMLRWRAFDSAGQAWLDTVISPNQWMPGVEIDPGFPHALTLKALQRAEQLRAGATTVLNGARVETRLEFNRHWGLGSSSTLIAALAELFDLDPYSLLEGSFGGSGYDLACARAEGPIIFSRSAGSVVVEPQQWSPDWLQRTCFVYRNQKQDSREGIRAYRAASIREEDRRRIGEITRALLQEGLYLRAAAQLLQEHETIVARTLQLPTLQEALFADFPGQLKSLGAWGGDFFWALSEENHEKVAAYFNDRGFSTVIPYNQMVL